MLISDWSSDVCSSDLGLNRCSPSGTSTLLNSPLFSYGAPGSRGWCRVRSVTDVTDQPGSDMNFHTLADHIPQHVWMANADGEIFWHNRQWHDYTGLGEEEARGLVWSAIRSEEHTSELQSLMRISYAVFC